jgi:hypothetical protein
MANANVKTRHLLALKLTQKHRCLVKALLESIACFSGPGSNSGRASSPKGCEILRVQSTTRPSSRPPCPGTTPGAGSWNKTGIQTYVINNHVGYWMGCGCNPPGHLLSGCGSQHKTKCHIWLPRAVLCQHWVSIVGIKKTASGTFIPWHRLVT